MPHARIARSAQQSAESASPAGATGRRPAFARRGATNVESTLPVTGLDEKRLRGRATRPERGCPHPQQCGIAKRLENRERANVAACCGGTPALRRAWTNNHLLDQINSKPTLALGSRRG